MTGKLTPAMLADLVFSRTGAPNEDVLFGPAFGEDAAALRVGDETLVVSSDPISLAAERIGTLGVAISSNDVAACGGVPEFLLPTVLLPRDDYELVDTITAQLDAEATRLGMSIVGGHSETVAGLDRPLLSLTCMGLTERYVPTSGATPGDRVILTKGAGIEATAVLATDFRDAVSLPADLLDRATAFFGDLSVLVESVVLAPVATAMHDPTEGGVLEGLLELALASGVSLVVDENAIPVREETRALCDALGVDPLRTLGSGALLATVPDSETEAVVGELADEGVEASVVGRVEEGDPGVTVDGTRYTDPVPDDIYDLWG